MTERIFLCLRSFTSLSLALTLLTIAAETVSAKTVPSLCRIHYPSDERIKSECRRIRKGESLESLFGEKWADVARFNRIDRRHAYPGTYIKIPVNIDEIKDFTPMPKFYKEAENEPKFILVDLTEQFLGAYEYGKLVLSAPIATGGQKNKTPAGQYRITAADSRHMSSLYFVEDTDKNYPMHYGLRFHINDAGVAFWIHGRDVPGYAASHGCIGLYDEQMQKNYYHYPKTPVLIDAQTLFDWVVSPDSDDGKYRVLKDGPRVLIVGEAPGPSARSGDKGPKRR